LIRFFAALFGSKKRMNIEAVPDHIWMTTDAKLAGLAKESGLAKQAEKRLGGFESCRLPRRLVEQRGVGC
jgi:hypothetical protein